MASAGWPNWTALPSTSIVPPEGRSDPGEDAEQLVLALALERDDAEDLAGEEIERYVLELGADAQVADAQARRVLGAAAARHRRCRAERRARVFSTGAPSISSTIRSSAPGAMSTTPTVSPSRSTVARSQSAEISSSRCEMKMTERPVWLWRRTTSRTFSARFGRQRRRHLVEQQHVRLDRQRPREVEDAQDGERDVPRRLAQIEVGNAELPDPAQEGLDRRLGEPQIGGDVEVGDQRRLLVDRHQAGAARLGGRVHVARASPRIRMRPASGRTPPVRIFTSVDLPAPFAPISAWTSPGLTDSEALRKRRDRAVVLGDAGRFQKQLVGHRLDGRRVRMQARAQERGRRPAPLRPIVLQIIRPGPCRR